jgi:hypothetical protein
MIEKEESRRIRREIDRVLLTVWDPIGIKEMQGPLDEYHGYVGDVFALLTENKSDEEIMEYLLWAVNERMGLNATSKDMLPTVRALRAIPLTVSK